MTYNEKLDEIIRLLKESREILEESNDAADAKEKKQQAEMEQGRGL